MVGVFVAFIRVVYGRMIYMSLPHRTRLFTSNRASGNETIRPLA